MASSRPLVMRLAADVKDWLRGTDRAERSMDDLAGSMDAAARDADKFDRDFTSAVKDAARAAERSSKNMGDAFDAAGREMGDVGGEVGSEFKSNLSESLSSGGSVEDILQDTFAGVISGLKGPLGLAAAAIAGAAALGFARWREESEKVMELTESRIELFRERLGMVSSEMDAAFRQEQKESWIIDNIDALQEMTPLLAAAGIDAQEYSDAMFHGGQAAQDMLDRVRGIRDADKVRVEQGDRISVRYGEQGQAANDLLTATEALVDTQQEVAAEQEAYNALVGTGREGVYGIAGAYDEVVRRMQANPPKIKATIEWYNTGPGAAYVDPHSASYSPGHVAINNIYLRAGSG